MKSLAISLLSLSFVVILLGEEKEPKKKPADLVRTQEGKLPIIISAPHGGTLEIPDVPEREGKDMKTGGAGFFAGRDGGTEELALDVAEAIEAKLGKKPYFVIARFHRKYLDANRPTDIGLESEKAKPTYEYYHGHLADYCKAVKKEFGRGLLIDIHGQGSKKDTVFRGTQNGKTVTLLRERYGEKAHFGPKSLFGLFEKEGWTVHPNEENQKEQAGFTGGYIVQTYGSHEKHMIDAMQLEFGADYRDKDARKKTAKALANAIAEYAELYLFDKPKPKK